MKLPETTLRLIESDIIAQMPKNLNIAAGPQMPQSLTPYTLPGSASPSSVGFSRLLVNDRTRDSAALTSVTAVRGEGCLTTRSGPFVDCNTAEPVRKNLERQP